jgi:hypothetical protein
MKRMINLPSILPRLAAAAVLRAAKLAPVVVLMEASYQVVRLPAFSVNRTSRLIKAPKLYWSDTGLAMYLSGEKEPRGVHLENLILMDLLAWRDVQPRRVLPIEVKASTRVSSSDAKGLTAFLEEYPALSEGALLLYAGRDTFALTPPIVASRIVADTLTFVEPSRIFSPSNMAAPNPCQCHPPGPAVLVDEQKTPGGYVRTRSMLILKYRRIRQ